MTAEVYPNPFHDGTLSVKVETRPPSAVRVRLFPSFDGRLRSASDNWETAQQGGAAVDQINTTDPYLYVGQYRAAGSPLYRLHESFVEFDFDTVGAVVPADATVEAVTLRGMLRSKATSGRDFDIEVFSFDFGSTFTAADWRTPDHLGALPRRAIADTALLSTNESFEFRNSVLGMEAAVRDALAGRKLRLVLVSGRFRTLGAPSGAEYVGVQSSEAESIFYALQLEVLYTPAYTHDEVELADAPCVGLKVSNSGPGGFGGASWRLSTEDAQGPYDALLAKGNLVTVTHGDSPAVTLHEGEITGDVSHPKADGGKLYYDVSSAGLWWRAGQRRDFAAVLFDDDVSQWFVSPLAAKGYTVDLDGRVYLSVETGQTVESGKSASVFYWLSDGLGGPYTEIREFLGVVRWACPVSGAATDVTLDYSTTTPFGSGAASPWTNLRTWSIGGATTGYALRQSLVGLGAKALRLRIVVPGGTSGFTIPREFEVWDPCVVVAPLRETDILSIATGNPATVNCGYGHQLQTGDRVFIQGTDSSPKIDGWREVTVLDPLTFTVAVNVTSAGGAAGKVCRAWRVDEAMAEVAAGEELGITTGLAEAADTEPVGHVHWNLVARPHETRADTLNRFAMLNAEPFDYGFWDNRRFAVGPSADPAPADRHFAVDATAAGVNVDVYREREDAAPLLKVLYTYRATKDANDPDSFKTSAYPDGITQAVYRPTDVLDMAAADTFVDVWTEFANESMTHDEASDLADQILAWIGATPASGTVRLSVPYIARADGNGEMLAAYLRGGDRLDIVNWSGYTDLPITNVDIDTASGVVTLGIGETRTEFVARVQAARDVAAPGKRLKRGWWKA